MKTETIQAEIRNTVTSAFAHMTQVHGSSQTNLADEKVFALVREATIIASMNSHVAAANKAINETKYAKAERECKYATAWAEELSKCDAQAAETAIGDIENIKEMIEKSITERIMSKISEHTNAAINATSKTETNTQRELAITWAKKLSNADEVKAAITKINNDIAKSSIERQTIKAKADLETYIAAAWEAHRKFDRPAEKEYCRLATILAARLKINISHRLPKRTEENSVDAFIAASKTEAAEAKAEEAKKTAA